ncbi:MAG: haloacid dehalogenase-like hydrolase, partial [Maritimibacter sp.]
MTASMPQTSETGTDERDIALVVDLDGTLSRTDTLHEALLALISADPSHAFRLPGWLRGGRAAFKAPIADRLVVDPENLPLNEAVVETIRAAREAGRHIALVSAADHRQVTAVAEATGLFDEAYGSAEGCNLKGEEKAAFLTQHFGPGKFDYIGDSSADLPVWTAARKAITVQAKPALR